MKREGGLKRGGEKGERLQNKEGREGGKEGGRKDRGRTEGYS